MNAVNPAFASILRNVCPPAPAQPMVDGEYLCTVSYDGLQLDVYGDEESFGGIALAGSKVYLCGVMSAGAINEIELLANSKLGRV